MLLNNWCKTLLNSCEKVLQMLIPKTSYTLTILVVDIIILLFIIFFKFLFAVFKVFQRRKWLR